MSLKRVEALEEDCDLGVKTVFETGHDSRLLEAIVTRFGKFFANFYAKDAREALKSTPLS